MRPRRPKRSERAWHLLCTLPAALYILLHLLGIRYPSPLWGADLLAYYDWWLTAVLVALPLLAVAVPARSLEPIRPLVCRAASWPPLPWVLFAGSIPLFWLARVRMHALGDSIKWFTVVGNAVERYRPFSEMRWHNASLDMPGLEFINFQQAL
ncbi:MAG: hypothetical protein QF834_07490, partial [Candidatus Thalassarchaeaceae archaeon]|nr:hypothetical protein [Candidatus Thalassarchaeaceae archaeon]